MRFIYSLFILLFISGCSSMSNGEINRLSRDIKNSPNSIVKKEITTTAPYKEAFLATASVFHDLSISILNKDFDGKEMLAIDWGAQKLLSNGGSSRYLVSFKESSGLTIISISALPLKYNFDVDFVLERIQKEIALGNKLK